jgi:hypothetical protein
MNARVSIGEKSVLCVMCAMKSRDSFASKILLILVFGCAICIPTIAQGRPQPGFGRLIVDRVPNFGWNLAFHLDIDGQSVGSIVQGRHFEGWVPAGPHVLTVYKVPRVGYNEPTSITVNVEAGMAYLLYAMWDSELVFLYPAAAWLTPGAIWQLRPGH